MLRLRTFGGLTLERDGTLCTGAATQRRRLALLALLAAGPEGGTSRDRIMAMLWPDADPARARHSLDDALSALRRDLGASLFLGVATLRLDPEVVESDVAERAAALRRGDLERAVALYTGPFLDGFAVPGTGEFERWMEQERARRRAEQTRALDTLATGAESRGDAAAALRWRSARLDLDPLDTPATLRLIEAQVAAGNHVEALRLARVHETLVREELESAPGPQWAAAIDRLRREPPAASAAAPPPRPVVEPATATPAAPRAVDATPVAARRPASRGGRRLLVAGAAAAAVLGVVLVAGAARSLGRRWTEPSRGVVSSGRVLIVPFRNATGDSTLTPLGRMASDWVAQGLADVQGVTVTTDPDLAPSADGVALRQAAAQQDVGTVISGAYYADGDSIRLQARVTEVRGWVLRPGVGPVSAPRSLPTALLEPLRQRLMVALAVTHDQRYAAFSGGVLPPTYEAYEQYLAGTAVFEQGRWEDALPYYTRAAALDSSYVQPLLGAVDAELNLGRVASADTLVRRLERRRAALSIGDQGSVDRLRGVIDGDATAALAGARASEAAFPGAQLPRYLHATTALRAGRPGEALAAAAPVASSFGRSRSAWTGGIYWSVVAAAHHLRGEYAAEREAARTARTYHDDSPDVRALELRAFAALGRLDSLRRGLAELSALPSTPGAASTPALLVSVAQELDAHGHAADARAALEQAVAAANALPPAAQRSPGARFDLAQALYLLGDYDAAAPIFATLASERPDDPRYVVARGLVAAHRGRRAEAARVDDELRALRRAYDRGQTAFARARLAAALGERDAALTLLRQALAEGVPYGTALHVDAELGPLFRSDSAFRSLLAPRG